MKKKLIKDNYILKHFFRKHKKRKNYKLLIKLFIIIILSYLSYLVYIFLQKYNYCYQCIEKSKDKDSKCLECPNEILFKHLYIVSKENTLKEIIQNNKSISRYGDGEISLLFGHNIPFQKASENLSNRLLEVINSKEKNLLIGIFFPYQKKEINTFKNRTFRFWKNWMYYNKFKMLKILKRKKYYSSSISRFYSHLEDKSKVYKYIEILKKIWEGKNVLMIEGEKTRFGIGNDLLNNSKSVKRILCPTKNSFRLYNKILKAALKVDKNNLILISLGPTATILAHDLTKYGYQAVDISHADIQYELYLRNATRHIGISYKYVNEYNFGKNEDSLEDAPDKKYYDQIIEKILH